jgi:hypothetical protein
MPLPIHSYRSKPHNMGSSSAALLAGVPCVVQAARARWYRPARAAPSRRHAHTPPPADSWAPLPSLSIPVSLVHVSRAHRLLPAAARIESRPSRAPRDGRRLIPTVHVQVPWDPRQGTHPPVLPVSRIRAMYCRSDGCPPLPGAI